MGTEVARRSVPSSELSKHSARVFAAAEQGPVQITRRDGRDLVLQVAAAVDGEHRAFAVASQVVAASLADQTRALEARMSTYFPWLEFLGDADRASFARELVEVTRACASIGDFSRLLEVFDSWQSTARALAAGYLRDDELEWLEAGEPVPDPRLG